MSAPTTSPAVSVARRRGTRTTRALGYAIAIIVNAVLIYLVNVSPGWGVLPFLTPSTAEVVPVLNAALCIGILGDILNIVIDRRWMRALSDIFSACATLAFIVATWRVFPFTFETASVDWSLMTRLLLAIVALGCVVGVIVQLVALAVEGSRWVAARRGTGV